MKKVGIKFLNVFIALLPFVGATIAGSFLESYYRKVVRSLYPLVSNHSVVFSGKGFHFGSYLFVFAFSTWVVLLVISVRFLPTHGKLLRFYPQ